jgi:hypothetical protein
MSFLNRNVIWAKIAIEGDASLLTHIYMRAHPHTRAYTFTPTPTRTRANTRARTHTHTHGYKNEHAGK